MLRGARIAVIDDVMTTGATLSECARVLREEGGAATVDAIVLARQPWFASAGVRHAGRADDSHAGRGNLTILGGGV